MPFVLPLKKSIFRYDIDDFSPNVDLKQQDFLGDVECDLAEVIQGTKSFGLGLVILLLYYFYFSGISSKNSTLTISCEETEAQNELIRFYINAKIFSAANKPFMNMFFDPKKYFCGRSDPFLEVYRLLDDNR